MPVQLGGQTYYRTLEACKKTGVSRATLFRWLRAGILEEYCKDRRGWRLFSEVDVERIRREADMVHVHRSQPPGSGNASEQHLSQANR